MINGHQALSVEETLTRHPAPWKYLLFGNRLVMVDARNEEVPLFSMADFCVGLTNQLARNAAARAATAAEQSTPV